MEKVEFITVTDELTGTISEHAIIYIEGGFITMPKEFYDRQQAEQLQPTVEETTP
jgi:hypothetical protein